MDKIYNPKQTEQEIYSLWDAEGYFTARIDKKKKPFVIVLPPPNVTGRLHIGHALTASIEDILVRYHRMQGRPTLWLPGVDHASIAVHNVVERELAKVGKTRFDLGRERFLEKVREWVNKYFIEINEQHEKLGISADWTRWRFTMDNQYQESVRVAFDRLKQKGLIYQGEYIVNWCPRCRTAISDLENIHEEKERTLWYLDYGIITIATTRPETIFADVAVAVNPKDKKYKNLVGKMATIPLARRQIPIIADDAVDPKFGTGALKITPAHDPTDFEIGQRHNLPSPSVIDEMGTMSGNEFVPEKYWGIPAAHARDEVVEDLKKGGLIKKEEKYVTSVGHCQRCNTITEPIISNQWFVKTTVLAKPAIEAVRKGKIKIVPKRFEKVYFQWMENIHDWCISRQLWWGHQIPGSDDVLDTWFSSSLWPFATLDWPEETEDYEYFYPTTVLETGYDILFFWVARMIMMGLELTGKPPFETVYLHGLVRDIKGQKMSKTLGNVLDPLAFIEKYGADALRMALVVGTTPGNDSRLSEEKIIGYRNFANKVWNIARFVLSNETGTQKSKVKSQNEDDQWILSELEKTIKGVTDDLNNFRLSPAGEEIYNFIWHKFADIYLEKTKDRREGAQPTLLYVLEKSLIMLHPFMPFVTEKIWQEGRRVIGRRDKSARRRDIWFSPHVIITAQWPFGKAQAFGSEAAQARRGQ